MKKFKYIAENAKETRTEGVKKAENEGKVVKWIYDSGLKPVAITEILPEKKQTSREQHDTPDTSQSMADGFKIFAETITTVMNNFTYRQNDPEFARLFITYEQSVSSWRNLTKESLGIDLPELPELPGNDYIAGMNHLARYCKDSAETLINPGKKKADSKETLKPLSNKLSAEAKLLGVLFLNKGKTRSIAWIAKEAGVSRKTAHASPMFMSLYNGNKPEKATRKRTQYSYDDNRDS